MSKRLLFSLCLLAISSLFIYGQKKSKSLVSSKEVFAESALLAKKVPLSVASAICTGPKQENLAGNIFCKCENTAPCRDMFGCTPSAGDLQ
jgi:hypothetical protein